jgi:aspartyl-tRNA(Asn)/glutamyl-tRNA(Gln) amidotransferase subunit A
MNFPESIIPEGAPSSKWDGYSGIRELADSLSERRASPTEVVRACLRRIERLGPELNACITVAEDSAMQAARQAQDEIGRGERRGPLHGAPVAIKDFYDTAGIPTTAGFEHFRSRIPSKDAAAVAKLKQAGAIIVGKTNMHSLGMGTTGLESAFGPVKNPWNADFIPGGSSSGSAAAVASGMCCATLDTDAIGSCRLPAACCGVVGFKGAYSLIDMAGILDGEQPPSQELLWLAHAGVTARCVHDVAIVLDTLVERDDVGSTTRFAQNLDQEPDLRIGAASNIRLDKEVADAFAGAIETIRGLGYPVGAVAAPLTDFSKGVSHIEVDRRNVAEDYFPKVDLIVLPTTPTTTPTVRTATGNPLALSAENTMFANYFGLPAISVPCGFDRRGLPLGLQIVGRPGEDKSVLQLAHRYQVASGYAEMRPLL